jgi:hypothetical protein
MLLCSDSQWKNSLGHDKTRKFLREEVKTGHVWELGT